MALYIVSRCNANNIPINNDKLQIILYYVQRDLLTYNSSYFDADIRAGEDGPVVTEVYARYMGYGKENLNIKFNGYTVLNYCFGRFVNKTIDYAALLTKNEIKKDILRKGGAWRKIRNKNPNSRDGGIIPRELIKESG